MSSLRRSRRRVVSRPVAALVSQCVVSGSSLLLQVVASRQGAVGLGRFSLLFGVLITLNAIVSGFIGDSLTVLDRFESGIRRALLRYQIAATLVEFMIGAGIAATVDGIDRTTALWFGGACAMWGIEETGRRIFIARRSFWKLVLNDLAYAAGSAAYLIAVAAYGETLTLRHLVLSLVVGAAAAIGLALIQLPSYELSRVRGAGSAQLRTVADFAVWRAAQVGLRPAAYAAVRAVVAGTAGIAALGELEGARLLVSPLLTIAAGAGVYLLPTYTAAEKEGRPLRPKVPVAMAALTGAFVVYGLAAVALRAPLTSLLTDGTYPVSGIAILSWALFSAAFAAGIPAGNAVVARGLSRRGFSIRALDAVIGIVCASTLAVAKWSNLVPLGLTAGALVGATLMLATLRPARPSAAVCRVLT